MAVHLLSARQVQVAQIGDHPDGGGLFLRVTATGASWVMRYSSPAGKRREMGLGRALRDTIAAAGASVTGARKATDRARAQLADGIDPVEQRKADREAAKAAIEAQRADQSRERWTLARCARDYHERVIEKNRIPKHAAQWISSLENHMPHALWHAPIDTITPPALLQALVAIGPHERARNFKGGIPHETIQRIAQRLDATFEDAAFHGRVSGNPAKAIKRKLSEALGSRERGHFAALEYDDIPDFMKRLRAIPGTAARMLEFAILTTARTETVQHCRWDQIDLRSGVWTAPAVHMKGEKGKRKEHDYFLSPRAVEIIEGLRELQSEWVFPSPVKRERLDRPLSNGAMLAVVKRMGLKGDMTPHGTARSTFATWSSDCKIASDPVTNATLAHKEKDKVWSAYMRSNYPADRRALLIAWSRYCNGETVEPVTVQPTATVIRMLAAIAA